MRGLSHFGALLIGLSMVVLAADPEGKAAFEKACKSCHGSNGEGNPKIAQMMKVTMRPLGSKEVQAKRDADLKKDIVKGNGKMKPVTRLSEKEVGEVVAFVRTFATK